MTTLVYQSKPLMRKVMNLAMNKFHVQANQIGLIAIEIDKKVYTKRGVELIHHDIFFTVFDNNLKSLGMIFERELRD